jgi:hypothetical protein
MNRVDDFSIKSLEIFLVLARNIPVRHHPGDHFLLRWSG